MLKWIDMLPDTMPRDTREALDKVTIKEALLISKNMLTLDQRNTVINLGGNGHYVTVSEFIESAIENERNK